MTMPRVPIIVPRGLSREESAAWLLEAVAAAREAAGHGEVGRRDGGDTQPDDDRDESGARDSPESRR